MVSFLNAVEGADAVTRAERWPISAPPSPTASAMDSLVGFAGGTGDAVSAGGSVAGTVGAVDVGADVSGTGVDAVGAVPGDEAEAGAGTGDGLGSTANALPASPGLAMSDAVKTAVPRTCRRGRRLLNWFRFIFAPETNDALPKAHHYG